MGWRDRYQQGSFRGVPFQIESGDDERAQRIVIHEAPARDKPFIENLGKKANRFTVEAFLLGDDYLEQRDSLQNACSQAGTGVLVHPYYGTLNVHCESVRTRHDRSEMRMVRISMSFVEVGELIPFISSIDTSTKVYLSANEALLTQKTNFEKVFDFVSLPYAKAQAVLSQVNQAVETIGAARKLVSQAPAFASEIQNIGGAVSTLVGDAEALANEIIFVLTFGFLTIDNDSDTTPDVKQSFGELANFFQYSSGTNPSSDASNQIDSLIIGAAIAQGAHMLSLISFDSTEEAFSFRKLLFDAIDSLQESDITDDIFESMADLRAQVERDINTRSVDLPSVIEVTLPETTPALVLSYRLYGNVGSESNILLRNHIAHPGFIPNDVPIKVLTND
jgi:prophage DNA circulation protein